MGNKILIIFTHPVYEHSEIQHLLIREAERKTFVTIRDLYQLYPDFDIDIRHEQKQVEQCDIMIWQHPLYWYNAPPMMKQWLDLVLEHGWAYGKNGDALQNKLIMSAVSTGGDAKAYSQEGRHVYPVRDFLLPFRQTAQLCGAYYPGHFMVQGTFTIEPDTRDRKVHDYSTLLDQLHLAKWATGLEGIDWKLIDFVKQ